MRVLGWLLVLLLGMERPATAQVLTGRRTPEEFGYRHLVVVFGKDSVDVLVQSKKGEEKLRKPLLLWCQGSLPTPLILVDKGGPYRVFPFISPAGADSLAATCHLAIIGKPGIALVADVEGQNPNRMFAEGPPPAAYCQRNHLGYYVRRNEAVLRYLKKQPWVDAHRVVVGGHSEGSAVVAHLAAVPGLVSRAVYLSGSPLGRELTKLARDPTDADSAVVEGKFARWARAGTHPTRTDCAAGDSDANIWSFGQSELPQLLRARVPIFVGYGTRDAGAMANDYLRLEVIRRRKTNFAFRAYVGREHNFFGFKNGQRNYDDNHWD
jgi:dienelactone hydrolase